MLFLKLIPATSGGLWIELPVAFHANRANSFPIRIPLRCFMVPPAAERQDPGITGSVGKTGTKEMLIQLLCSKFNTVGTEKNFNNEIGVPLALSNIGVNTEMAVIEMAMRARGEISLLSRIAQPDLALITNTAGSHVGRLGSFDEVFRAKCEIADGMKDGSLVVLNRRDTNVLRSMDELRQRRGGPILAGHKCKLNGMVEKPAQGVMKPVDLCSLSVNFFSFVSKKHFS